MSYWSLTVPIKVANVGKIYDIIKDNIKSLFQIVLSAQSGNGGFIAVDDITVTKGQCKGTVHFSRIIY